MTDQEFEDNVCDLVERLKAPLSYVPAWWLAFAKQVIADALRAQRTEGRPLENMPEPELWCTACDTHIPGSEWRGACPTCGNGTMREVPFVRCLDCQMIYGGGGWLDTSLPHDQWKLIHPDEGGILCANCITARAAKLHGVIRMVTRIEFAKDVDKRAEQSQVADLRSQIETLTASLKAREQELDAAGLLLASVLKDREAAEAQLAAGGRSDEMLPLSPTDESVHCESSALRAIPCVACGAPTYEDGRHQRDDSKAPYCALCGSGKVTGRSEGRATWQPWEVTRAIQPLQEEIRQRHTHPGKPGNPIGPNEDIEIFERAIALIRAASGEDQSS